MANSFGKGIVTDGLAGYFDPGNFRSYSGTDNTVNSILGINTTMSLYNSPGFTTSPSSAFVFNGTSHYMKIGTITFKSIFMFLNKGTKDTGWAYLFDSRPGYSNGYFANAGIGGWSNMYVNGQSVASSWASLPTNTWCALYTQTGGAVSYTSMINIMSRYTDNECLPGQIGVILIYNKALTQSEIQQNFEALRGRYGI